MQDDLFRNYNKIDINDIQIKEEFLDVPKIQYNLSLNSNFIQFSENQNPIIQEILKEASFDKLLKVFENKFLKILQVTNDSERKILKLIRIQRELDFKEVSLSDRFIKYPYYITFKRTVGELQNYFDQSNKKGNFFKTFFNIIDNLNFLTKSTFPEKIFSDFNDPIFDDDKIRNLFRDHFYSKTKTDNFLFARYSPTEKILFAISLEHLHRLLDETAEISEEENFESYMHFIRVLLYYYLAKIHYRLFYIIFFCESEILNNQVDRYDYWLKTNKANYLTDMLLKTNSHYLLYCSKNIRFKNPLNFTSLHALHNYTHPLFNKNDLEMIIETLNTSENFKDNDFDASYQQLSNDSQISNWLEYLSLLYENVLELKDEYKMERETSEKLILISLRLHIDRYLNNDNLKDESFFNKFSLHDKSLVKTKFDDIFKDDIALNFDPKKPIRHWNVTAYMKIYSSKLNLNPYFESYVNYNILDVLKDKLNELLTTLKSYLKSKSKLNVGIVNNNSINNKLVITQIEKIFIFIKSWNWRLNDGNYLQKNFYPDLKAFEDLIKILR